MAVSTLSATELADRLAGGETMTILDVREETNGEIDAASATIVHSRPSRLLADPAAQVEKLAAPVIVVCSRGRTAEPVAEALRALSVDATVLEGGIRAWIGTLRARPVDFQSAGLEIIQVQRPGRGCLSYLVMWRGGGACRRSGPRRLPSTSPGPSGRGP